jgi:hypothetical protein
MSIVQIGSGPSHTVKVEMPEGKFPQPLDLAPLRETNGVLVDIESQLRDISGFIGLAARVLPEISTHLGKPSVTPENIINIPEIKIPQVIIHREPAEPLPISLNIPLPYLIFAAILHVTMLGVILGVAIHR